MARPALDHILITQPGDGLGCDLVCTMPAGVARSASGGHALVTFGPPVDVAGFDLAMYWHPRRERDPAARWLRDQLRAAAAELV